MDEVGSVRDVRIATWNVNSLKARLERVEEWLAQVQPDVLCMQETKLADEAFPALAFQALGYETAHHGEGRWNGVAIASRVGLDDVVAGFGRRRRARRRGPADLGDVRRRAGGAASTCPTGASLDDDHYQYKLRWLERLAARARRRSTTRRRCSPSCGDFNIAPDDRDVYDPAAFVGATHTSEPEREALARLEDWGLVDVFRQHYDAGGLFSLVGLPGRQLPQGQGHAHRPRAGHRRRWPRARRATLIDRNARKGKGP